MGFSPDSAYFQRGAPKDFWEFYIGATLPNLHFVSISAIKCVIFAGEYQTIMCMAFFFYRVPKCSKICSFFAYIFPK